MTASHVYRVFDTQGRLLYIGCTKDPESRIRSHFRQGSIWAPFAARLTWESYPTRDEGVIAETLAILYEHPHFNKRGNAPYTNAPREPFPDAEQTGIHFLDLIAGAPGRRETVFDRKRRALRSLRCGAVA